MKKEVVGVAISLEGDLSISGTGDFRSVSWRSENGFGVKVTDGNGSIYLRIGITKSPIEFIGDADIFDGTNTISGLTSSTNNYEEKIRISRFYLDRRSSWADL